MKFRSIFLATIASLLMVACDISPLPEEPSPYPELQRCTFTPLTYDEEVTQNPRICNPERGPYVSTTISLPLAMREEHVQADRIAGRSLRNLLFYLTRYIDCDIEPEYLEKMQESFDGLRKHGGKAVVRFAYKNGMDESYAPWDATPEWVARHIEQVTPILRKNADVIFVVQAGFFGAWGEWHTSSNFDTKTPEGIATCREVIIEGLLNALPSDRQVQVRTPQYKIDMYGLTSADTLTVARAHDGSPISRIAGHNDCFLAGHNDFGTFANMRGKGDWLYWDTETRYTIMGGETCDISAGKHHCDNALKRLAEQHWTYLNQGGYSGVFPAWRTEGCYKEAMARLGYRFVFQSAYVTPEAQVCAGGDYRVVLNILNDGFAAPMNPRGVELVLVDSSGEEYFYKLNSDPRFWFEGVVTTLDTTIQLPEALRSGECKLYLNLPDGYESLARNPLYSIRLMNRGVWNKEKGYNLITSFKI